MGAVTNWSAPVYLQLLEQYQTSLDSLNSGAAIMILLLGVGNMFTTPLSNSEHHSMALHNQIATNHPPELGRRFIYLLSLFTVMLSQVWMALSKTVGDFYGVQVLSGLGAAPFEALVAISIADVWFAHERGSKLGAYVFGLAFGSFIGPLCSGYMAASQGWRWIFWWGAILSGVLCAVFFFTFEESRFVRGEGSAVEEAFVEEVGQTQDSDHVRRHSCVKDGDEIIKGDEEDLDRQVSHGPKVGEVFDAVGFTFQYRVYKMYPDAWKEIISQMWRPLKVTTLPAVVWVSIIDHQLPTTPASCLL